MKTLDYKSKTFIPSIWAGWSETNEQIHMFISLKQLLEKKYIRK